MRKQELNSQTVSLRNSIMHQKNKTDKHWEKHSKWRITTWILSNNNAKIKIRNAFPKNMSTDIKPAKARFSRLIESRVFLGSLLVHWPKLLFPWIKMLCHH